MPVLTQGAPDYDVVIVADEKEVFGPYLPFRTWDPRPVAGTAGLKAMSWHPAHEQWGATQMQNRFQRFANRFMLPLDYQAWVAVRAIGEGVDAGAAQPTSPRSTPISEATSSNLAAFKGQKVTFRSWDGQLRQPIIVAGSRSCRCRCHRKKASCMSRPRSTRSASMSRRPSASSNKSTLGAREDDECRGLRTLPSPSPSQAA